MSRRTALLVVAVATTVAVVAPWNAAAHDQREVGGYELVVGWLNEPAYAGFINAVQVIISDGAGNPVTQLDGLQVEVAFVDERTGPLPLSPAFGETVGTPGEYHAPLVPTRPGEYTFRFVGEIEGVPVDEAFTAGDETFDPVVDPAEIQFPVRDPSPAELGERIDRLDARLDGTGERGLWTEPATLLGGAGAALGLAALATALVALRRR